MQGAGGERKGIGGRKEAAPSLSGTVGNTFVSGMHLGRLVCSEAQGWDYGTEVARGGGGLWMGTL